LQNASYTGDDLAVPGVVNGVGDLPEHRFHLLTPLGNVGIAVEFGHRFHDVSPTGVGVSIPQF